MRSHSSAGTDEEDVITAVTTRQDHTSHRPGASAVLASAAAAALVVLAIALILQHLVSAAPMPRPAAGVSAAPAGGGNEDHPRAPAGGNEHHPRAGRQAAVGPQHPH